MTLFQIYKRFRWKILITFSLLSTENVLTVLQPFVIGIAINDILNQSFDGLIWFSALYLAGFVIGISRRFYDTRAYTKIYATIASETVERQQARDEKNSAVIARAALAKELVDFFEQDLPFTVSSIIKVTGAMGMLLFLDAPLFLGCLGCMVLFALIYWAVEGRISRFHKQLNDEIERRVEVISKRSQPAIVAHFRNQAKWLVKLSDTDSVTFGIMELILFGLMMFALLVSVNGPNPTAGGIFSILSYVLEFAEGVFFLPMIFQQLLRLKDISARLKQ